MRRALLSVTFLVGVSVLASGTPASAQASSPRPRLATGTWVGEVQRHDRHLDYVGSPCPVEAEVCVDFIARYLILPTSPQVFRALRSVAGGPATLRARLVPGAIGGHQGILVVSAVL